MLRTIRELADADLIEIGDLSGEGGRFSGWGLSVPEAVKKIEHDWQALGRPANISDVCWTANTMEGDRVARYFDDGQGYEALRPSEE